MPARVDAANGHAAPAPEVVAPEVVAPAAAARDVEQSIVVEPTVVEPTVVEPTDVELTDVEPTVGEPTGAEPGIETSDTGASSSAAESSSTPAPPALPPLPPLSAAEAAVVFAQGRTADSSDQLEDDAPGEAAASAETTPAPTRPTSGRFADRLKRLFAPAPTPRVDDPARADVVDMTRDEPVVAEVADETRTDDSVVEVVNASAVDATEAVDVEDSDEKPEPVRLDDTVPSTGTVLAVRGLTKSFGDTRAVDRLDLDVHAGSFYGIVGPNGAGKTTTLSMITGLLRPDAGSVTVNGIDVWSDPSAAKRTIGVLPDRLRVFDRLTGAQLLYYAGMLRGLTSDVVRSRVDDLARAFGLEDAMGRLVSDYSAGMVKKVSLAAAMIHSPRVLVLDEPFESVDPVSAARIVEILRSFVDNGGTVVLSSHSMDFIQRVCDHVAIIVEGQVLAAGAVEDVRGPVSLEERFLELAGGRKAAEGMEWLHSFSG
jgi:ABC-2 type transport system ATP-binding protein